MPGRRRFTNQTTASAPNHTSSSSGEVDGLIRTAAAAKTADARKLALVGASLYSARIATAHRMSATARMSGRMSSRYQLSRQLEYPLRKSRELEPTPSQIIGNRA